MNRIPYRFKKSLLALIVTISLLISPIAAASPFGQGLFGEDVPFGSLTSVAINLGGNVSLTLAPDAGNLRGVGSHTITVTSNDVVGYQLFVRSDGAANMTSGAASIPASGNASPAPLSLNSWGFNTDASTNFVGMTTTPYLIKDTTGPSKNGDDTTVTYSAYTSPTQDAGTYTTSVIYTVIAENQ